MTEQLSESARVISAATILVVDDEPTLREAIAYALRREGFKVEVAAEGGRAITIARERKPDLVVLDVMLPGLDGLQVCRVLRRESSVPILMLSAKGEELDRVLGLEIGADDYLTKPFAMQELLARIRANLRRVQIETDRNARIPANAGQIAMGDLRVDSNARRAFVRDVEISLKPREFDLLAYLVANPGRAISRDQLLRDVWDYQTAMDTRTVDVHVRWLRQKLGEAGGNVPEIETSRKVGYRLSLPAIDPIPTT
jgi:two-component system alkaline phosphatase synthesis response regulator PhoP